LYVDLVKQKVTLHTETLRKRLRFLIKLGLIERIGHTNPSIYQIGEDKEEVVRRIIKDFMVWINSV